MGNQIAFIQIGPEFAKSAQISNTGDREKQIDKNQQHEELHNIGIDYAEKSGGRCIDDKNDSGNQGAHFIAYTYLASDQADNRGGGGNLCSDGSHHRKGDHG